MPARHRFIPLQGPNISTNDHNSQFPQPNARQQEVDEDHVIRGNRGNRFTMNPDKFNGSGEIEGFLTKLNICARHNGWDNREKLAFLQNAMEGPAIQLIWEDRNEESMSFEDLVSKLRQRFGSASHAATHRPSYTIRNKEKRNP